VVTALFLSCVLSISLLLPSVIKYVTFDLQVCCSSGPSLLKRCMEMCVAYDSHFSIVLSTVFLLLFLYIFSWCCFIFYWYSFWMQNELVQLWACTICAAYNFEFAHQMSLLFLTACSWKDQSHWFTVDSSSGGSFSREPGKKRLLLFLYIRNEYHNFTCLTFFQPFSIGQPTVSGSEWESTVGRGMCIICKLLLSVIQRSNLVIFFL
jgi:hypothetical protein